MKRNEFLFRLALENKMAVVSENIAITQISKNFEHTAPNNTLSHACQTYSANNVSVIPLSDEFQSPTKQVDSSSLPNTLNVDTSQTNLLRDQLQEKQLVYSLVPESTALEDSTVGVNVTDPNIYKSTICHDSWSLSSQPQDINVRIGNTVLDESILKVNNKTDSQTNTLSQGYIPEVIDSVKSFSDCDELVNADSITSILESKTLVESTSPTSNISLSSSVVPDSEDNDNPDWYRHDSESYDDHNFQNDNSESEYLPSNSAYSSTSTSESSLHEEVNQIPLRSKDLLLELEKAKKFDRGNIQSTSLPNLALADSTNSQYIKKPAARERPTLCPICFHDVVTHFTRHLFRHHENNKNVKLIKSLKPGSKERLALVAALRKQGYFHLNNEKNILNPVRTSKNPKADYFVCTYCLGHYSKKLLYKHVKKCKNKPENIINPGKNCLTESQTFMASVLSKNYEYLKTSRIKKEVFQIMRADNISAVAKNDPLICLYGETLLSKHKRQQIANVISNKVREMARMLIALRTINSDIHGLFDVLKPEMFRCLISAVKVISGYEETIKSFKAPSLALHMGTNLKIVCDVALKIVIEKRQLPNIKWDNREEKKTEIKDLKKLIEGHWCNEISSLALKTLKERHWEKPVQLPLTKDILTFQTHVNELAENAYTKLSNNVDMRTNYKILTECVLAQTVMFNRKRVGDVQYLKIETYTKDNCRIDEDAFIASLTATEKILCKQFKRIVTGGKGSKPVPILFSRRIQTFISCLLDIRATTNIVPKSNPYLFANPGSENKWMAGANVIRRLANNCGAQRPMLLTSTKFRKHIATTLQLMSMQPHEMEQIATFMGHTKKTHAEFYRLPQDIFQTAKVAKVLLLLEKGKGKEFRGKSLNEIELDRNVYYSSESDEDDNDISNIQSTIENTVPSMLNNELSHMEEFRNNGEYRTKKATELLDEIVEEREITEEEPTEVPSKDIEQIELRNEKEINHNKTMPMTIKKLSGRIRWTNEEKKCVLKYFQQHLKSKVTPKKHECIQFLEKHGEKIKNKDWVRVKTLVYNSFRGN